MPVARQHSMALARVTPFLAIVLAAVFGVHPVLLAGPVAAVRAIAFSEPAGETSLRLPWILPTDFSLDIDLPLGAARLVGVAAASLAHGADTVSLSLRPHIDPPLAVDATWGIPLVDLSFPSSSYQPLLAFGGLPLGGLAAAAVRADTRGRVASFAFDATLLLADVNFPETFTSLHDPLPSPSASGVTYQLPYDDASWHFGAILGMRYDGPLGVTTSVRVGMNADVWHTAAAPWWSLEAAPWALAAFPEVLELRAVRFREAVLPPGAGWLHPTLAVGASELPLGLSFHASSAFDSTTPLSVESVARLRWEGRRAALEAGGVASALAFDRFWYAGRYGRQWALWIDEGMLYSIGFGDTLHFGLTQTWGRREIGWRAAFRPCVGTWGYVSWRGPTCVYGWDGTLLVRLHYAYAGGGFVAASGLDASFRTRLGERAAAELRASWRGRALDEVSFIIATPCDVEETP